MKTRALLINLLVGALLATACTNKKSSPSNNSENNQPATSAQAATQPSEPAANPSTPPPTTSTPPASAPEKSPATGSRAAAPSETAKAEPVPPPKPQPLVIPSGTVLTVRLDQEVSSKTSHEGDPFNATLEQPLVINGTTVAPVGTPASGKVTEAHAAGKFKGGATLNLSLDTVLIQQSRYQIQATPITQTSKGKGKRSATMIGGGTGAGALIGGIAGGGKGAAIGALVGAGAGTAGAGMTGNKNDITLPAEAALSFKLTAPVTLKVPQPITQADK